MRSLFLVIFICSISFSAIAEDSLALWKEAKTITGENYKLSVPKNFRQFPMQGNEGPEQYFEGSGIGLPAIFNQAPVILNVFLVREDCHSLEDCKRKCLEGYNINSDRVFPAGWQDGQEKLMLTSGEEATVLHTRFYRPSKGLSQSRFDLVTYSNKAKAGYFYTLSIQHADDTYQIETDLNIPSFAKDLFNRFQLKSSSEQSNLPKPL